MGEKMTRGDAEALANEMNSKKEPQWFCPLINGPCNKECVNFIPAFVESTKEELLHDTKDTVFVVKGFVCSNYQFVGPSPLCEG